MKRRCVLLLLLLVPLTEVFGAEVVAWIGTRERALDPMIDIPVDVQPNAEAVVDKIQPSVIQITTSGRELNATAVRTEWYKRGTQRYLRVKPEVAQFKKAGTYFVKIRIPAVEELTPSLIELTITRPAADLSFAVPPRVERVVYIPGLLDCWFPRKWSLAASDENVTPTSPGWVVAFNGPDQKPIGSRLNLTFPREVAAGTQGDVVLSQTTGFPLGTSTGKVVIAAPQLTRPFESSLEVFSRVSRWWLLITIGFGIVIGHFVRKTLEQRRLRALAMANAGEQLQELKQLTDTTIDETFKGDLEKAVTELENAARAGDADLQSAMKNATSSVEAIRGQMMAAQTVASGALSKLRTSISDPASQFGPLQTALEGLAKDVDDAQKNLTAGQLTRAKADAARIEQAMPKQLEETRLQWQASVSGVISKAGSWPELKADEQLQQVRAAVTQVPAVTSFDTATTFVAEARNVTGQLRGALFAVVNGARELAGQAATKLEPSRPETGVATTLDLLNGLGQQEMATDIESLAEQAAQLRSAITVALKSVSLIAETSIPAQAAMDVAPSPPSIPAMLIVEDQAVVGRTMRVRLQVDDPSIAASTVVVTWFRDDERLYTSAPGELTWRYRPTDIQPVVLRADVIAGDRSGTASKSIGAREQFEIDPAAYRRKGLTEEWKQTIISGALIVFIGYFLFADTFLGKPAQFLAAALWGFVIDVTLPNLMTLATPAGVVMGPVRPPSSQPPPPPPKF